MQDRVCYFSKDDLSLGHYLGMAEKRIQEVSKGDMPTDIEGIIELWHIKRMFENDCRLLKWDDKEYQALKNQTNEYNKIIASYMDGYLYLVIAQGRSLLLCNCFQAPDFTTAEYFIFMVMKKLQLNPEVSTICFRTGLQEEQEMSLYRYFKNVEQI